MKRERLNKQPEVMYSNHYSAGIIPYIKMDNEYKVLLVKKPVVCQIQIYSYLNKHMKDNTKYNGLELLKRKFYSHGGGMLVAAGGGREDTLGEHGKPYLTAAREFTEEVLTLFTDNNPNLNEKIKKHIGMFLNYSDVLYALPGEARYAYGKGKHDPKKRSCYPFYGLDITAFLKYVEVKDKESYQEIHDIFNKILDSKCIAKQNEMVCEANFELLKALQNKKNNESNHINTNDLKHYEVYVHPWVNLTEALTLIKGNKNKKEAIKEENEPWLEYLFPIYQELLPIELDSLNIKNKDDFNTKISEHLSYGGTDYLVKAIEELQYYIETEQNVQNNETRFKNEKTANPEPSSSQNNSNQQSYKSAETNQMSPNEGFFNHKRYGNQPNNNTTESKPMGYSIDRNYNRK